MNYRVSIQRISAYCKSWFLSYRKNNIVFVEVFSFVMYLKTFYCTFEMRKKIFSYYIMFLFQTILLKSNIFFFCERKVFLFPQSVRARSQKTSRTQSRTLLFFWAVFFPASSPFFFFWSLVSRKFVGKSRCRHQVRWIFNNPSNSKWTIKKFTARDWAARARKKSNFLFYRRKITMSRGGDIVVDCCRRFLNP